MIYRRKERFPPKYCYSLSLNEDSSIVKDAIKEIIAEKQSLQDTEKKREDELRTMMNKHFDEFDDVFKALA